MFLHFIFLYKVNGIYERTKTQNINDRPSWALQRKTDDQNLVLWCLTDANFLKKSKNRDTELWMISRTEHINTQNAYACLHISANSNPFLVNKTWKEFTNGKYVTSSNTTIFFSSFCLFKNVES